MEIVYDVNGLKITVSEGVYPPSDDTWLMVRTLAKIPLRWHYKKNLLLIDCCCGCGVIGIVLWYLIRRNITCEVFFTDIDVKAVKNCWKNIKENNVLGHVIRCDNISALRGDIMKIIVCNPPYLPEEEIDRNIPEKHWWCGGPTGIELSKRIVENVEKGVIIILVSSRSNYKDLIEYVKKVKKMDVVLIAKKRFFFETLMIFMFL